jgi:beta-galactosidase GanA
LLTLPRLPVPGLWLDVFQKIKALGYNAVSFYVDWALVEGKQGDFTAEGIFAWEPFFEAAQEAGIYLIAVSLLTHYHHHLTD